MHTSTLVSAISNLGRHPEELRSRHTPTPALIVQVQLELETGAKTEGR
jgi:hypothetical protein